MTPGPLELADIQARADFVHDAADRLVEINDIGGGEPPWALVIRTAEGSLTRFRVGAPGVLVEEVTAFADSLPLLSLDIDGPGEEAGMLREIVGRHIEVKRTWAGPAYTFPAALFQPIGAAQIYPGNAALLHPQLASWAPELRQRKPCFGVFRNGQAIAICASSRTTAQAAEAGVETVTEFRGEGAAGLAVAAWAAAVRDSGRIPIYSTSWENLASRAVAAKLELDLFAEDLHIT